MSPTDDRILFITLDSCRFDTFVESRIPNLKAIAPFYKSQAPGYFTYGLALGHVCRFHARHRGLRPDVFRSEVRQALQACRHGVSRQGTEGYALSARNIIEGFNKLGYKTIGAAAMGGFDPATITGAHLTDSFSRFFYAASISWTRKSDSSMSGLFELFGTDHGFHHS